MLVPVLVVALLGNTPGGRRARGDRLRAGVADRLHRRLPRARARLGHDVRQADGPARRQAADRGRADLARLAAPTRRVGGDGDHHPRARRHRAAHGRHPGGRRDRASMFGKVKTCLQIAAILAVIAVHGQPRGSPRSSTSTVAGHRALRPGLLLRPAPAHGAGAQPRPRAERARLRAPASSHSSRLVWCGASRPTRARLAARRAGRGARRRRCAGGSSRGSPGGPRGSWRRPARGKRGPRRAIISRTQSSTKRGRRWAFSTTSTSSARFISS